MLGGTDRPATLAGETPAGTGDESPGVHLTHCEMLRDLPVRVVERLAKDVNASFGGDSFSRRAHSRELERFALLRGKRCAS